MWNHRVKKRAREAATSGPVATGSVVLMHAQRIEPDELSVPEEEALIAEVRAVVRKARNAGLGMSVIEEEVVSELMADD